MPSQPSADRRRVPLRTGAEREHDGAASDLEELVILGKINGNDVADGQLALVEHQLGLLRRCIAAALRFSCAFDVSLCFGGGAR